MNGAQDMGGMHGFGPVEPEPNEPVFHAEWESRAFALTLAMAHARPAGTSTCRASRARTAAAGRYLSMSYYQIWFAGLETMLKERELVGRRRDRGRPRAASRPKPVTRMLSPGDVAQVLHRGGPTERDDQSAGAFKPGDRVRAKNINPVTHTRLPRYVRGHVGTIERVLGCHVFPDSNAHGAGENPQWLYTVGFDGRELWGAGRRSEREGLGRRLGAVSGTGMIDQAAAARATQEVPSIPRDADGPVFREPWEAQAFALAVALHERGLFTWSEWAAALGAEIKRAQAAGDPDTGETYYLHWLAALERLVAEKGVATPRDAAPLPRRLGARLRAHAARPADRTEGRGFFLTVIAGLVPAISLASPSQDFSRDYIAFAT